MLRRFQHSSTFARNQERGGPPLVERIFPTYINKAVGVSHRHIATGRLRATMSDGSMNGLLAGVSAWLANDEAIDHPQACLRVELWGDMTLTSNRRTTTSRTTEMMSSTTTMFMDRDLQGTCHHSGLLATTLPPTKLRWLERIRNVSLTSLSLRTPSRDRETYWTRTRSRVPTMVALTLTNLSVR